jgi:hypothetical protein
VHELPAGGDVRQQPVEITGAVGGGGQAPSRCRTFRRRPAGVQPGLICSSPRPFHSCR